MVFLTIKTASSMQQKKDSEKNDVEFDGKTTE